VRTGEKSAGNGFKLLRCEVASELTAEQPIVLIIRHDYSPVIDNFGRLFVSVETSPLPRQSGRYPLAKPARYHPGGLLMVLMM
jgi:hypothetical protein